MGVTQVQDAVYCVLVLSNNFGCVLDLSRNRIAATLCGMLPDEDELDEMFNDCKCVANVDAFIDVINAFESCKNIKEGLRDILDYTKTHSYFCEKCVENVHKKFTAFYTKSAENKKVSFGPGAFPFSTCVWAHHVFRQLSMSADVDDYNQVEFTTTSQENLQFFVYGNCPDIPFFSIPVADLQSTEDLVAFPV